MMTTAARAPRGTLLKGHLDAFAADKLAFLTRCAREYGDAVPLRLGPLRYWLVSDPALIGAVLTSRAGSFRKDLATRRARVVLGDGLLTSEGAAHERQSRLARPAFRVREVEPYAGGMVELARRVARSWPDGGTIDLGAELARLTLAIAARTLFGADLLEGAPAVAAALGDVLALFEERLHQALPLPLAIPTRKNRRFLRARAVLDGAVLGVIRARREGGPAPGGGLFWRLASGPERLDERELRDEAMTLLLAGHETTANALAFALWLLAANPDVARRLREEVQEVLGGRAASAADVPRLELAAQVFAEAIRLFPPVWMTGRQALEDVDLARGVTIRRGAVVAMSPFIVHRDPRWWADPQAFRPERFARGAPRPAPFTYFPFGGGARACIGRAFATLEGTLLLATLAQEVELEVATAAGEPPLLAQMTLRPSGGMRAVVRRR